MHLTIYLGDKFAELVRPYLKTRLEKGVPSLFADLKSLYRSPEKRNAIEAAVTSLLSTLQHPPTAPSPPDTDPSEYIWALYFLAQHYSFLGNHKKAVELLDEAIAHTPTLPELYMFKARVLKRAGDPFGAAKNMDLGRTLDLQDRFLNTKAGKYRLRAGLVEEAVELFGLFTKVGRRAKCRWPYGLLLIFACGCLRGRRKTPRVHHTTLRTCSRSSTSPKRLMRS